MRKVTFYDDFNYTQSKTTSTSNKDGIYFSKSASPKNPYSYAMFYQGHNYSAGPEIQKSNNELTFDFNNNAGEADSLITMNGNINEIITSLTANPDNNVLYSHAANIQPIIEAINFLWYKFNGITVPSTDSTSRLYVQNKSLTLAPSSISLSSVVHDLDSKTYTITSTSSNGTVSTAVELTYNGSKLSLSQLTITPSTYSIISSSGNSAIQFTAAGNYTLSYNNLNETVKVSDPTIKCGYTLTPANAPIAVYQREKTTYIDYSNYSGTPNATVNVYTYVGSVQSSTTSFVIAGTERPAPDTPSGNLSKLSTPANLKATSTYNSVTLQWGKVVNASDYNVTFNVTEYTNVGENAYQSHSISGLTPNTSYSYSVQAVGNNIAYSNSDYTSTGTIYTKVATPSVSSSSVSSTSYTVNWGTIAGATGYTITVNQGSTTVATYTTTNLSYTITGLTTNTQYKISVVAKGGHSNDSAAKSVTIKTASSDDTTEYKYYVGTVLRDNITTDYLTNLINNSNTTSSTKLTQIQLPDEDSSDKFHVFIYPDIWGKLVATCDERGNEDVKYELTREGIDNPANYYVYLFPADGGHKNSIVKLTF